ncbi:MAG: hypothetical protein ACE5H3_07340 [Planctomycetota bacterium]
MIALALCFGLLFLPLGFSQQQGNGSGTGSILNSEWSIGPNGTAYLVFEAAAAQRALVHNDGPDSVKLVKIHDGKEEPAITVPPGKDSPQIGLQVGDSLAVRDGSPPEGETERQGASGRLTTSVP